MLISGLKTEGLQISINPRPESKTRFSSYFHHILTLPVTCYLSSARLVAHKDQVTKCGLVCLSKNRLILEKIDKIDFPCQRSPKMQIERENWSFLKLVLYAKDRKGIENLLRYAYW